MGMEMISLAGDGLAAAINPLGAELSSLRGGGGHEVLWQAGPAWRRHAPVLFPIVGRLAGDTLRHRGLTTKLTQHGFARDRMFTVAERGRESCTLVLEDDEATRAMFPFGFRLTLRYSIEGDTLVTGYRLENPGGTELLASLGTHPAFRWPLADGVAKEAHRLVFEHAETEPLLRLEDGLTAAERVASPVHGRVLALSEALFAHDALIFERPASRMVRYEAPGTDAPAVEVAWEGFSELGIWSRPADFVCIEPWSGLSDRSGFAGEWADKPGLISVAPAWFGDAVAQDPGVPAGPIGVLQGRMGRSRSAGMRDLVDAVPVVSRLELGPGAVLLGGFALDAADELTAAIADVAARAPFRRLTTPGGRTMSVAMTNCGALGWVSDRRGYRYEASDPMTGAAWPAMPERFLGLARAAAGAAGFAGFAPDCCLINRYEPGTALSAHVDHDEADLVSPIVSVSLGAPATFLWGGTTRDAPMRRMRLAPGDVVVWGGESRLVYHGVARLAAGSEVRLNLTFRSTGRGSGS